MAGCKLYFKYMAEKINLKKEKEKKKTNLLKIKPNQQ